jgi:cob(I)alamin adenosyltransferase
MGDGFTWETQDQERDIASASAAWQKTCELLKDETITVVLLDELNIALNLKYIQVEDVITALRSRPAQQHVVITGRGAPDALIDFADTVTEMKLLKHAYHAGVKAQNGVEL